jgi:hypothetical protein
MRIRCILDFKDLEFQESFNDLEDSTLINKRFSEFLASMKPTTSDPVQLLIDLEIRHLGRDSPTKISFVKRIIQGHDKRNRKI